MKYRVTFSPNGKEPFTYGTDDSLEKSLRLANMLANFDLGRSIEEPSHMMISMYKKYRQKHDINHHSLISYSTGSVDEMDENGAWWVVSESLNEREFEVGEMPAFDNHIGDLYIKEKHNADECIGFIDGLEKSAFISEFSEKDLENRVKIIKLLQVIGCVDAPFEENDDYSIHNPYLGNITNILVKDNKITLICLRPGLVIGKGGRNMNYIKQQIEADLGQEFEYMIEEDRFWNVY